MKPETVLTVARLEGVRATLRFLAEHGSDREVGRRALLLAYVFDPGIVGSTRDIAKRMGVSPGRVGQMTSAAKQGLARLCAKQLTAKPG